MVADFDFNNITSLTANKCSYSYVVLVHLYLTVFKMQCWRSQADYKKPYLCSRLYKKENNELFGLGTPLQAGNLFRTKCTCSLKLVHFARLCAFHSRNINHHFPPLAFSGRCSLPVRLHHQLSHRATGGGCQFCACHPSIAARGLNQARSRSEFIISWIQSVSSLF